MHILSVSGRVLLHDCKWKEWLCLLYFVNDSLLLRFDEFWWSGGVLCRIRLFELDGGHEYRPSLQRQGVLLVEVDPSIFIPPFYASGPEFVCCRFDCLIGGMYFQHRQFVRGVLYPVQVLLVDGLSLYG